MSMTLDSGSIGGETLSGCTRKARTYPRGRTCAKEGCGTRLSVYNSRPCCSVHDFDRHADGLSVRDSAHNRRVRPAA